jgi:aryl sulfotransferase
VSTGPIHHQSPGENNGRWLGFRFRPGDIVISTRPRTGTTWLQMICALLIFQSPELPDPLWRLSPWLDNVAMPDEAVYAELAAQRHRRFVKTHTPLDGIPLDPHVTYIVTARHPLDAYVSICHHNELLPPPGGFGPPPGGFGPPPGGLGPPPGGFGPPPGGLGPPPGGFGPPPGRQLSDQPRPPGPPRVPRPPMSPEMLHNALLRWVADDDDARRDPNSLRSVMWHLSDAWARRSEPNVLLVRYEDLLADLEGQMRWLAGRLGIAVPEHAWPALAEAATFEHMRDRADILVSPPPGTSAAASFFRRGTSGAGHEILSDDEMAGYYARAAQLAPSDMLDWLHSPSSLTG